MVDECLPVAYFFWKSVLWSTIFWAKMHAFSPLRDLQFILIYQSPSKVFPKFIPTFLIL